MDLGSLMAQYGYYAVLLGMLAEGETALVLAGYAAHRGYMQLELVLAVAWAGAILGDQCWFWLGRHHGAGMVRRFPGLGPRVDRALRLIERHPVKIVFSMRFLLGLRIVLPLALGMSTVRWRLYAGLTAVAAAIWVAIIGLAGYAFGALLSRLLGRVERYEHSIFAAVVAVALVAHLIARYRTRI